MTRRRMDPAPDAFAIVMATGVVSIAARDHAYHLIADVLGLLAAVAFCALALDTAVTIYRRSRRFAVHARDPDVALKMFTFVAACAILAARWNGLPGIDRTLCSIGVVAWLALAVLAVRDVASRRIGYLRDHAHGAWLLPAVAAEGLATAGSALLPFATVALFVGIVVYLAVTSLIIWRVMSTPRTRDEMTPDSWILMGGLAVTTLAAAHLSSPIPVLRPLTLIAWIGASAWIPLLVYAEIWLLDGSTGSLRYQGAWWSTVFPLGMYAAASHSTAAVLDLPSLDTVSLVFFWIAAAVWLTVGVGLAHSTSTTLRSNNGHNQPL